MRGAELFQSAQRHLIGAGGRYHPLLNRPLYLARGKGSRIWDVDGKEYIDFFTGAGANFLGHDHPAITTAIRQALEVGVICNGETEYQSHLAARHPWHREAGDRPGFHDPHTMALLGEGTIPERRKSHAQESDSIAQGCRNQPSSLPGDSGRKCALHTGGRGVR